MTTEREREARELPCVFWRAINPAGGYMHFDYEPTHLADYEGLVLESDAKQAIAESEARAEVDARRLDWLVGQTRLIDLYNMVAQYCDCPMPTTPALARAAIDAAIDAAQEAEREAASA